MVNYKLVNRTITEDELDYLRKPNTKVALFKVENSDKAKNKNVLVSMTDKDLDHYLYQEPDIVLEDARKLLESNLEKVEGGIVFEDVLDMSQSNFGIVQGKTIFEYVDKESTKKTVLDLENLYIIDLNDAL